MKSEHEQWVFIKSEPGLWTVGFYGPDKWMPESDHGTQELAAARVHYLNGGTNPSEYQHGFVEGKEMAAQHEPKLYCVKGPTISGKDGTYTIANVGCSCGWNKDGEVGEGRWADHIRALERQP